MFLFDLNCIFNCQIQRVNCSLCPVDLRLRSSSET